MEQKSLIDEIVALEWDMFSAVPNVGGPAFCQEDQRTFQVMRRSQAQTWSGPLLESYLADLQAARSQGINLMTLKYARMMATTHPDEYALIQDQLPPLDPLTCERIEAIIAIHRVWDQAMNQCYPNLRGHGRPATSQEDSTIKTSAETYMRGELQTYSPCTIELYYQETMQAKDQGINLAEQTLDYMVRAYGYHSLEEAEKNL